MESLDSLNQSRESPGQAITGTVPVILFTPSLMSFYHLLESLGILFWAIVMLEIILCRNHICFGLIS